MLMNSPITVLKSGLPTTPQLIALGFCWLVGYSRNLKWTRSISAMICFIVLWFYRPLEKTFLLNLQKPEGHSVLYLMLALSEQPPETVFLVLSRELWMVQ